MKCLFDLFVRRDEVQVRQEPLFWCGEADSGSHSRGHAAKKKADIHRYSEAGCVLLKAIQAGGFSRGSARVGQLFDALVKLSRPMMCGTLTITPIDSATTILFFLHAAVASKAFPT